MIVIKNNLTKVSLSSKSVFNNKHILQSTIINNNKYLQLLLQGRLVPIYEQNLHFYDFSDYKMN